MFAGVNLSSLFVRINPNFVKMVLLTDDNPCWIHNVCAEKHRGSEKNYENVFK